MVVDFTIPAGVIVLGIIVATIAYIILARVSNKIITLLQLYPESKGILPLSLKLITWCVSGIVFLLFFRFALVTWELDFTASVVEELILVSPKYILAVILIIAGFYISRIVKEKSSTYSFEHKNRVLLVVDLIIHMTFFFTALSVIGIDTKFFVIFYYFVLGVVGFIVSITVGLALAIPLGIGLYKKLINKK